ncbi:MULTISPECIES: hypothetical protein [Enterobacteriaceae]|nr:MULTISPECIES: hypothetical protein [Enterobacteriaceae]BBQ83102.1 hypothetical protein WP3W18E02_16310 [Klebsiella sp. WP3-W18-ESBL-02]BBR20197.1 hypothetical protein WP3S18E05_16770 [Klebsiella sp. WP3-S18-ESBL-05]
MRKPTASTVMEGTPNWQVYLGVVVFLPMLTGYSLYLAYGYISQLWLFPMPDFWSQSMLEASIACCGPALLLFTILGNLKLLFSITLPIPLVQRILTPIAWLTLTLLLTANALILLLHISYFSPDRYIRCWEPFPVGTWYYARTAGICAQHGLAPVQFLNIHSSAKNVSAR